LLKEEPPDLSSVGAGILPGLERGVRHCLEKNPAERFQSARDLAFDLESLSMSSGDLRMPGERAPRPGSLARVAFALLVASLLVLAGFQLGKRSASMPPVAPVVRSMVMLPEEVTLGSMALSPNGKQIALSGTDSGGRFHLWVRSLDGLDFRPLRA